MHAFMVNQKLNKLKSTIEQYICVKSNPFNNATYYNPRHTTIQP